MSPHETDHDALRILDATVRIDGARILGPLSLTVRSGESWVILGPNGSGKTTLLGLAGGMRHPTTGDVEVLGDRMGTVDIRALRARIGFVGHRLAEAIPAHLPVREIVLAGTRSATVPWMQTFDDEERRLTEDLLVRVGCAGLADRPLATCSQGERQRVLLARALAARPDLLLLDEPMAGLDLPGRELLIDALTSTAASAPTTVLVTHHFEEIPKTTTHAALLRDGRIMASGPVHDVLTDENATRCFGRELAVHARGGRWRADTV